MLSWEKEREAKTPDDNLKSFSLHTCDTRGNYKEINNIENSISKNYCKYNL